MRSGTGQERLARSKAVLGTVWPLEKVCVRVCVRVCTHPCPELWAGCPEPFLGLRVTVRFPKGGLMQWFRPWALRLAHLAWSPTAVPGAVWPEASCPLLSSSTRPAAAWSQGPSRGGAGFRCSWQAPAPGPRLLISELRPLWELGRCGAWDGLPLMPRSAGAGGGGKRGASGPAGGRCG